MSYLMLSLVLPQFYKTHGCLTTVNSTPYIFINAARQEDNGIQKVLLCGFTPARFGSVRMQKNPTHYMIICITLENPEYVVPYLL